MKIFGFWVGKVLALLLVAASAALVCGLIQLKLLPTEITAAVAVMLALVTALVAVLTWRGKGKVCMSIGVLLAVLMLALLIVGNIYLWQTVDTVRNVTTNSETETVHVGIYVRSEDADAYSEQAATLRYGILGTIDRQATDAVLQELEASLGCKLATAEYLSPPILINALLNKQVDAIVLTQTFYTMFTEMPDLADWIGGIREVALKTAEVEIVPPSEPDPTATVPTLPQPPASVPTLPPETAPGVTDPTAPSVPETTPGTAPSDPQATQEATEPCTSQPVATQPTVVPPAVQPAPVQNSFCIYISGIDISGPVSARSYSDVNILAFVNPSTRQILLVNTPRDYYLPLSISGGIPDKLTFAGTYGVQVSMDTLEMLYGVNIDYYFRVNFSGFQQIVDALGGVTVHSDVAFTRKGYHYVKGPNHLNGVQALEFCRERHAFADGDNQRGRNQMALIKAVFDKVMSPALLTNYMQVLDAVEGSFRTSVPMEVVGQLVSGQLKDSRSWNIVSYSVTGTGDYAMIFSWPEAQWIMWPDTASVARAKTLIASLYSGQTVQP